VYCTRPIRTSGYSYNFCGTLPGPSAGILDFLIKTITIYSEELFYEELYEFKNDLKDIFIAIGLVKKNYFGSYIL
jgi:hypothetical protein